MAALRRPRNNAQPLKVPMLTQKEKLTDRVSKLIGQFAKAKRPNGGLFFQSMNIEDRAGSTCRSNIEEIDDGEVRTGDNFCKKQKRLGEDLFLTTSQKNLITAIDSFEHIKYLNDEDMK